MSTENNSTTIDTENTNGANGTGNGTGFDLDTAPDISELEERGVTVHIRDASGAKMYDAGTPVTMTVLGTYSKTYRRLATAQRDQLLRMRRSSLSADHLDKNDIAITAACVTAWQGFKASGAPIPFTKENVVKVFTKFPYVLEQVKEEMGARENFSERSSPPSATP